MMSILEVRKLRLREDTPFALCVWQGPYSNPVPDPEHWMLVLLLATTHCAW